MHHPEVRGLFTRDAVLASDWYRQRLVAKQRVDERHCRRHVDALTRRLEETSAAEASLVDRMQNRRAGASNRLEQSGTLGVDPSLYEVAKQ